MSGHFLRKDGGFDPEQEKDLFNTPPDTVRKQARSRTEPKSSLKQFNNQGDDLEDPTTSEESTPRIRMTRSNLLSRKNNNKIEMKYQSQSQNDLQKLNAQLEEHLAASEKCANEAISCENNTTLEA